MERVYRKEMEIPLSMKIIGGEFKHGDRIVIDCVNDALVFENAGVEA